MNTIKLLIQRMCVFVLLLLSFTRCVATQNEDLETQYKRIGVDAMAKIVEGDTDGAIDDMHLYLGIYPDDPEFYYVMTIAYVQKQEPDSALAYARRALDAGLAPGRFLSGPRNMLQSLLDDPAFVSLLGDQVPARLHGPLLGRVTDNSAGFWIRTRTEMPVGVVLQETGRSTPALHSDVVVTDADNDYTAVIMVGGLDPDTRYNYRLVVDGKEDAEEWSFRTFPAQDRQARFSVGFGGGGGFTPWHERMWNTISARRPDAFLMMGDNVYIDHPTMPDVQRYCYYRRLSRPEFLFFSASTSIYAIWDDHDFTVNDGWGGSAIDDPEWKIPVWRIFKENWNNPYYGGGESRPGCWFDFSIADVDFFMLDGRYYRTAPDETTTSMLGPGQKAWLFEALAQSDATFKVLVSPVPWAFGTKGGSQQTPEGRRPGGSDTWEGFPDEREEIFSFLEENRTEGIVLLSADRHRSDVWKIERPDGYALYEFESSRLTNIHSHGPMPGSLFSYNEKPSFGLLSFDTTLPDPELVYRIINIDNEVIHSFMVKNSQLAYPE